MTSVSDQAASASERLRSAGVFEFSQAHSTILSTLGSPEGAEAERGLEILQLTSAEFSLLPIYLMPQTLTLPLMEPLSVSGRAAVAAMTKGSCTLANPYHHDRNVAVFLGDMQKLVTSEEGHRLLSIGYETLSGEFVAGEQPDWNLLASELQNQYRRADTAIGNTIAESGVVRLQTVIWAAKWVTIVPQSDVDLLALAQSLGTV